jgi:hypothetical protein
MERSAPLRGPAGTAMTTDRSPQRAQDRRDQVSDRSPDPLIVRRIARDRTAGAMTTAGTGLGPAWVMGRGPMAESA